MKGCEPLVNKGPKRSYPTYAAVKLVV